MTKIIYNPERAKLMALAQEMRKQALFCSTMATTDTWIEGDNSPYSIKAERLRRDADSLEKEALVLPLTIEVDE